MSVSDQVTINLLLGRADCSFAGGSAMVSMTTRSDNRNIEVFGRDSSSILIAGLGYNRREKRQYYTQLSTLFEHKAGSCKINVDINTEES